MRFMVLVASLGLGGCTGPAMMTPKAAVFGPGATNQERAFQLTWEGVLHMEPGSRPVVTWGNCQASHDGVSVPGACYTSTVDPNGQVDIEWTGSIHSSPWSTAMLAWRQFLLTGTNMPPLPADAETLIAQENAALGTL